MGEVRMPLPANPPPAAQGARPATAIDRTIQERIAAHQSMIAAAAPGAHRLNLLADGDSWFDYPLSGEGILIPSDIIVQLRRSVTPYILDLAHYGDATTQLLGVSKRNRLLDTLRNPANGTFDAILFSGGGNDLVGDQFRLWLVDAASDQDDPANALNPDSLGDIMGVVRSAYIDLMAARDVQDHDIPIFVHAYDFARPTDNGVCGVGPWLYPSLNSRGWMRNTGDADIDRGASIVKEILQKFAVMLEELADVSENNLVFVTTQGTLAVDDWANELHPKPEGFAKIAGKFADALRQRFGG
jgi:hypothetical protein